MKTRFQLLAIALILVSFAAETFACACCAEPGTYFRSTSAVDDYEKEILSGMKFDSTTSLYTDEAGFEVIHGLAGWGAVSEASETWSEFDKIAIDGGFSSASWKWNLSLGKLNGSISLPLPAEREYFGADIHDGRESSGGGPLLYKELRFKGKVGSGTGFFAEGLKKGADFQVVFQGRGNGCNNVEDFTHWRLSVNGPDTRYAFYGKLASGKLYEKVKGK